MLNKQKDRNGQIFIHAKIQIEPIGPKILWMGASFLRKYNKIPCKCVLFILNFDRLFCLPAPTDCVLSLAKLLPNQKYGTISENMTKSKINPFIHFDCIQYVVPVLEKINLRLTTNDSKMHGRISDMFKKRPRAFWLTCLSKDFGASFIVKFFCAPFLV